MCEIGIGEASWEEDEDRKYVEDHRNEFRMYIPVRTAGTQPSRLNSIETMRWPQSDVGHVVLR